MTLCYIGGVRIKLHPSILLLVALCVLLSDIYSFLLVLLLVTLHELSHCLVAFLCGIEIIEIELAPFGGVARMEGLDTNPFREALVAAAGPLCNLVLAMLASLLAFLWPQASEFAGRLIALNLTLMFFNLIPALPLDGGRILRALLQGFLGYRRVSRFVAVLGVLCGLSTALLCLPVYHASGKWNVTLVISGAYIAVVALRELRNAKLDAARGMLRLRVRMEKGRPVKVETIAVQADTQPLELVRHFKPGRLYRVLYVDERQRVVRERYQWDVQKELMEG